MVISKVKDFTLNVMGIVEKADEEAFPVSLDWRGKIGGNKSHFAVSFDSQFLKKDIFSIQQDLLQLSPLLNL